MTDQQYNLPPKLNVISVDDLKGAEPELQFEVMEAWFLNNFQDPVHECPYDSGAGGYIYIHGGPYEANEQLFLEFGDLVPEEVINKLISELGDISDVWSGVAHDYDDDYLISTIGTVEEPFKGLSESIDKQRELLDVELSVELRQQLNRMIFINLITSLEAYLSDYFVNRIELHQNEFQKYVETNQEFLKEKFQLSRIYESFYQLEETVKKSLAKVLWHNLSKVRQMYKSCFDIEFHESEKELMKAVNVRHDLVHRNGKDRDGGIINIGNDQIENLINNIFELVNPIENFSPKIEF